MIKYYGISNYIKLLPLESYMLVGIDSQMMQELAKRTLLLRFVLLGWRPIG